MKKLRIDKVRISNFKNYYTGITFDLNKQITILHGDNGYGKSSFFDAIEWCLTNNIDRYNGSDSDIKKDIINRNCDLSNLTVSVEIEFGGNKLSRFFNVTNGDIKNTQVIITSNEGVNIRGQENVENFLKKEYFENVNFGKGVYGKLIKQTYILSQDQVTEFINSEDGGERYRALANIMGLKSMLNETDNAKKILSGLKTKEKEVMRDLENYDNTIKSKEELKRSFDLYSLNLKINRLGINISGNNLDDECKKVEDELINDKNQAKRFLMLYKDMNLDNYTSIEVLTNQIIQDEESRKVQQRKIKKREKLLTKINKQINGLKKEKEDVNKYNQIRSDIRENEERLDNLNIKNKNIKEVNAKLDILRGNASKLEYQISIRKSFNMNNKTIEELNSENDSLQKKCELRRRRKDKLLHIEQKLSLIVDSSKNKVMAQLISSIKDIKNHVEVNNLKQCPVCSSTPEQNLGECIDTNILYLNNQLQADTKYLEKSMNLLKKIELKTDEFDREIKGINFQTESNNLILQRVSDEILNAKSNILYDPKLEIYSDSKVNKDLNEIRKSIISLQTSINILLRLNQLYKQINNIEGIGDLNKSTAFRDKEEIDKLLKKLMILEESISHRKINNQIKINEIDINIRRLDSILIRVKDYISLEYQAKPFREIFNIESKNETDLNEKINELSIVKKMASDLKINEEIKQQISEINDKKLLQVKQKHKLEQIIESLDKHLQNMAEIYGNEAKDFLNKENSSIQKFFRYLNPFPSNSLLIFEGEEEELNIKIDFDNENSRNQLMSNAKNVLSSGQLNVLAISIFLAINEGQKTHSLDFVAIDDPIQNMDDVNQYSICDVLGGIGKQLIISTHDLEFLKLFIKKNEQRKENIQVYSFLGPYLKKDKVNKILFN